MKKQILHKILALGLLLGMSLPALAQRITDNAVFYHSFRSPWSNELNPALFPKNSGFYLTTAKTSLALELPLSYSELGLRYDPEQDVTILNVNDMLNNLYNNGCVISNTNDVNLLGFGFTITDKLHLTFSAGLHTITTVNVPLGALKLLTDGNMNEEGHLDFGGDEIFSQQLYAYAAASGAFKVPFIPLTVGGRFKLLNGVNAMSLDNLTVDLVTPEDVSKLQLRTNYQLHTAGIITGPEMDFSTLDYRVILDQLKQFINMGYTFDLGCKYKLGPLDLSLSVVDLGPGIKWRNNPQVWVPKEQEITISYDGIDLTTLISQGNVSTDFLAAWKDSLESMIDYTSEECEYWYSIPTNLYAGASISLGRLVRAGYLFQGQWTHGWINNNHGGDNHFCCNNTLSGHLNLFNWLELSAANSFTFDGSHFTWLNPGAAVTFSLAKTSQLFVALEYASSMRLTEVKALHVMFGLNLVGYRK